jgi:hypothetical protein
VETGPNRTRHSFQNIGFSLLSAFSLIDHHFPKTGSERRVTVWLLQLLQGSALGLPSDGSLQWLVSSNGRLTLSKVLPGDQLPSNCVLSLLPSGVPLCSCFCASSLCTYGEKAKVSDILVGIVLLAALIGKAPDQGVF